MNKNLIHAKKMIWNLLLTQRQRSRSCKALKTLRRHCASRLSCSRRSNSQITQVAVVIELKGRSQYSKIGSFKTSLINPTMILLSKEIKYNQRGFQSQETKRQDHRSSNSIYLRSLWRYRDHQLKSPLELVYHGNIISHLRD